MWASPTHAQLTTPRVINPFTDLTTEEGRPARLFGGYQPKAVDVKGSFRLRSHLWSNFDLDRGLLPGGDPLWPASPSAPADETVTFADMRLRLEPEVRLGQEVRVAAQIDMLDNVLLGSTPRGFPPSVYAPQVAGSTSQEPPSAGWNAMQDSLRVEKAWVEVLLPFGFLTAGRMGNDWGLGLMADSGADLDDDFDDAVDRVGFVTTLWDHYIGLAYDMNASGPSTASSANPTGLVVDVTDRDDVNTLSLAVLRYQTPVVVRARLDADRVVFNYGSYFTLRRQDEELPSYYRLGIEGEDRHYQESEFVTRGVDFIGGDLWFRLNVQRLRVELEAAYVTGWADNASLIPGVDMDTLTFNQWGGVLQAEWQPAAALPLTVQLESGVASGDRAWGMGAYPSLDQLTTEAGDLNGPQFHLPGDTGIDNFRFHPNFHVDRILWRRLVGTFTDGLFVKGRARWFPLEALRVDASVIYSRALYAESTPGLARPLGVEAMLDLTWYWRHGLEITADYAFLYPLAGFRDAFAGVDPSPAHAAELHLGVRF